MSRSIPFLILSALFAVSPVHAQSRAHAAPIQLAIPPQALTTALETWSKQSGIQVMYAMDVMQGLKSQGAPKGISADEALKKILSGTGLTFRVLNDRSVSVVPEREAAQGEGPADQMRVARASGSSPESSSEDTEAPRRNEVIVEGQRDSLKPFAANADIARTENDAQPYYVFDAKVINQSGALNVEDFLKQRLTMNTTALTNAQVSEANQRGNTSDFNLRGLGADKTLVLINGRRVVGVNVETNDYQPDLNGIPLGAIERIEVLPSSASGIYGGGAIGGVINVILKRDYVGGEMRLGYDSTWDGKSPGRNVAANYGLTLEEGRSHLGFGMSWSDRRPLVLQERAAVFRKNLDEMRSRNENFIYSSSSPWLGSLPNIVEMSGAATLILKNGSVPLNAITTHIPSNTSDSTLEAELDAGLLANAGRWNLEFPRSTQAPTGLLQPFGSTPETRSFQVNFRREMAPWLELVADISWNRNQTDSIYHPMSGGGLWIDASIPSNPFTTAVFVRIPDAAQIPFTTRSENRGAMVGAIAKLPWGWTGALDYAWSENHFDYTYYAEDTTARDADLMSGELNPFVDTLRFPLDLQKYLTSYFYQGDNRLHDIALRGSGPLPALPWGRPTLTFGIERRIARTPERTIDYAYPITVEYSQMNRYYARDSRTDSGYLEALVPLVKPDRLPLLRSLELQLSGRSERYEVDTGTPLEEILYNHNPPIVSYGRPRTASGEPFFSRAAYTSTNHTIGLKYQPVPEVTLRFSRATAFLPPTPADLTASPATQATEWDQIVDPVTATTLNGGFEIIRGGNPNLVPQNSKSFNAGVIWEPRNQALSGLRMNVEYYRIEQFDAIGSLGAQDFVNQETSYPGRVTRDANGAITRIDASAVNLYRRESEGWDLSASYTLETSAGRFSLRAVESIIQHLKNQYAQTQPEYDAVRFPSEGGAAKHKTNVSLGWDARQWTASWSAKYFGSYRQFGTEGGPYSTQYGPIDDFSTTQGGVSVPSQTYHDLFVSYSFNEVPGSAAASPGRFLDGLTVQFGIRNIFDKVPPLDAYYASNFYLSPYGDAKLRSYWLAATVDF